MSPDVKFLNDIQDLPKEDNVELEDCLADLLWSNPNTDLTKGEWDFSPEGIGFQFPLCATRNFMANNKLSLIVRGHSFVTSGVETFHEGSILSVFSATNHLLTGNAIGGLVEVNYKGEVVK